MPHQRSVLSSKKRVELTHSTLTTTHIINTACHIINTACHIINTARLSEANNNLEAEVQELGVRVYVVFGYD